MNKPPYSPRKFPVNSRSAWIGQLHKTADRICVPFEIHEVGPGNYEPSSPSRHIGSPQIRPSYYFTEDGWQREELPDINNHTKVRKIKTADPSSSRRFGRNESSTIFHDHSTRMGLDPSLRTIETPGSNLAHCN
jgi:hypothetical protein